MPAPGIGKITLTLPQAMQQAGAAYSRRDWAEAERLCRLVLNAKADFLDALTLLGIIAAQTHRAQEAEALFGRALAVDPNDVLAHINRGLALQELERSDEALASYDQAIRLNPDYPAAYFNRGNALQDLERLNEALASYEQAIKLEPDYPAAHFNRGNVLDELMRRDEALASYEQAIKLEPDFADAYNNRGLALKGLRRLDEALASYEQAIKHKPGFADAYVNHGNALQQLKRMEEALTSYEQAMKLKPDIDFLRGNLLHTKMQICDWSNAEDQVMDVADRIQREEKATAPFAFLARSSSLPLQRKAAEIWVKSKYPLNLALGSIRKRARHGKIRIGYFSADFRNHPVSLLTVELFETHDRTKFDVFAFSTGPDTKDEIRSRLKSAFDKFIDVGNKADRDVAEQARALEIDIAIDLGGHTQDSRTGIFAMRAAPLQVNFLGYPGTMGAAYMDYLVADNTIIPEWRRRHYSEKIAYLPSYQPNDSKRAIAEKAFNRQEFGLPHTGFVFCCFNNHYKITPGVFDVWMRILRQVDASVLWLSEGHDSAMRNLKKEAALRGIAAERLIFAKRMPLPEEHLARHRLADLFIDTLPYNAHTTASDALWAGLPVLTCTADTFASRVAASLLNAINLPELVTSTQTEYEALAVALATHPERLRQIRQELGRNRLTTPLFDTRLFTKHLEDAYTQMYERHQADLPPDHIHAAS